MLRYSFSNTILRFEVIFFKFYTLGFLDILHFFEEVLLNYIDVISVFLFFRPKEYN